MRSGSSLSGVQGTYFPSAQSTRCFLHLWIFKSVFIRIPYSSKQYCGSLAKIPGPLLMFSDWPQNWAQGCSTGFWTWFWVRYCLAWSYVGGSYGTKEGLSNNHKSECLHYISLLSLSLLSKWQSRVLGTLGEQLLQPAIMWSGSGISRWTLSPSVNVKPPPIILFSFHLMISLEIS